MDRTLCSLCAWRIWGRTGADAGRVTPSPGHAGSLVGGERGYTRAKCEQRLLDRVGPKVLEQNSDGWVQTDSIPYKCALPHPDVCVYVPVCVAVCVCVFLIRTDTTLDLSQKAEKRCVCIPVCVPVYVCVHHWVLETAGKISLLVDLFLVMTSSLVCSSCS